MILFNSAGDGIDVYRALEEDEDAYATCLSVLEDAISGTLKAGSLGMGREESIIREIGDAIAAVLKEQDPHWHAVKRS